MLNTIDVSILVESNIQYSVFDGHHKFILQYSITCSIPGTFFDLLHIWKSSFEYRGLITKN